MKELLQSSHLKSDEAAVNEAHTGPIKFEANERRLVEGSMEAVREGGSEIEIGLGGVGIRLATVFI